MYSLVGLGGLRVLPQHAAIEIEMHSTWRVTTDALITGNYRCLINYGKAICSHTCYRLTRHSNWGTLLGSSRWYVVRISWYRVDTYFRPSWSHRSWFSVFWRWSVSAATISSRTWKCNSRSWTECNRTVSNCGIGAYIFFLFASHSGLSARAASCSTSFFISGFCYIQMAESNKN